MTLTSIDDSNFDTAVTAWLSNPTTAESTYGHISNWDTSAVTNMDSAFRSGTGYNGVTINFNEDLSGWVTTSVTNMNRMFEGARIFNSNLSTRTVDGITYWDVSNVTKMYSMFKTALKFNGDITNWDTGKVPDFTNMFHWANTFNQDISNWDVSSATKMPSMFGGTYKLNQDLRAWNVDKVTNFSSMFGSSHIMTQSDASGGKDAPVNPTAAYFVLPITNSNFNTALDEYFSVSSSPYDINAAIHGRTTQSVTNITKYGEPATWDTSSVIDMSGAFKDGNNSRDTTTFNEDLSGWVTSAVTDMTSMFEGASSFNKELKADVGGKWDVSSVDNMTNMFSGATDFNQSVRNWRVREGTTLDTMFSGSHPKMLDGTNGFSSDYITPEVVGRGGGGTTSHQYFSLQPTEFQAGLTNWFATPQVKTYGEMGDWNVGAITGFGWVFENKRTFNEDIGSWNMESATTMESMFQGCWAFNNGGAEGTSNNPLNWDTSKVTHIGNMFRDCRSFNQDIDTSGGYWNTGEVLNTSTMFYGAGKFYQNIGNWNTSKVTKMEEMFNSSSWEIGKTLANNLKSWNVDKVAAVTPGQYVGFFHMFNGNSSQTPTAADFTLPVTSANFNDAINEHFNPTTGNGGIQNGTYTKYGYMNTWDTSAVTDMSNVFKNGQNGNNTVNFNEDISNWNTSAVTDMASMFNDASGFNQDISGWNLGSVTSIAGMFKGAATFNNASASMVNWLATPNAGLDNLTELFSGATAFNVALTNWDTSKITNMSYMFKNADAFNQDISTWDMSSVTNTTGMFADEAASAAATKEADDAVSKTTAAVANLDPADKTAIIAIAQELDDKKVELTSAIGTFTDTGITGYTATERRSINNEQGTALTGIKALLNPSIVTIGAAATLQRKTVIANLKTALNLIISSAGVNSIEIDVSQLVLSGEYDDGEKIVVAKANTTIRDPVGTPPSNFYSTLSNDGDWVERKYNPGVIQDGDSFTIKLLRNDNGDQERYELYLTGTPTWGKLLATPDPDGANWSDRFDATNGSGYLLVGDKIIFYGTTDHAYLIIGSGEGGAAGNTICFLGDTKVKTDQGLIRFDTLTLDNTINNYKIKRITKVKNADDHMIFIEKNALGENIPNKDTYISKNHGIIVHGHLVRAKTLVNGDTIRKAYRKRDSIYNILTEVYTIIYVNNMPCETLNPNDPIVRRFI